MVLLVVVVAVPVAEVVVVVELLVTVTGQLTDFASMTTLGPKLQLLVVVFEEDEAGLELVEVEPGVVEVEVEPVDVEDAEVGVEPPSVAEDAGAGEADRDVEFFRTSVALPLEVAVCLEGVLVVEGRMDPPRTDTVVVVTVEVEANPDEVAEGVRFTAVVAVADAAVLADADAEVTGDSRTEPDVAPDSTGAGDNSCEAPVARDKAPALTVPSPKATFISMTAKAMRPVRTIHLRRCVRTASMSPLAARAPKQGPLPEVSIGSRASPAEDRDVCSMQVYMRPDPRTMRFVAKPTVLIVYLVLVG